VRRRITAIATIIVAVVLVAVAVVAVLTVRRELVENLDRSLDQRAAEVDHLLADGNVGLVTSNREDHFAQVLADDGSVIASTDNAAAVSVADSLPEGSTNAFTTTDLPIEDDAYRVLIRRSDVDGVGFIVVGENIDDLRDTTRALVVTLLVVIPVAVALLAIVVWWLVGRTLGPVDAIRREVDEIGLRDLGRRVPAPGTGDEVDRLAATMNEMLGRLEISAEQQRRFVADASHELRTPLTRLRTSLEVEMAANASEVPTIVASALEDTIDMQMLVDDLLFLARRDAGVGPGALALVDLDVVVDSEARTSRLPDGPAVDMRGVSAAAVLGSERALRRLVRNLLSNAVRHARTTVELSLVEDRDHVVLSVADDGSGIDPADRDRVFERFVRLDDSRTGVGGGTGLGLAIVREIAHDHHGSARVEEAPGGGARFVVTFPTPDTAGSAPTDLGLRAADRR